MSAETPANRWNRQNPRTWFLSVLHVAGQPLFDDTFEQPAVFGYMGFNKEKVLTKKEKNYKKFIFSHKMAQDVHILNKYFF